MSKEKGYGTKVIASVPYPSIFDSLIKKQMILQKIDFFFLFLILYLAHSTIA